MWRVLGVTLTMLVVGALGGYALAQRERGPTYIGDPPAPVPAVSPSYPAGHIEVNEDPDLPRLEPGLPLERRTFGPKGLGVTVAVPKDWTVSQPGSGEWRFQPEGGSYNTFHLRVELVDGLRLTVPQATAERLRILGTVVFDLQPEQSVDNAFVATYVTGAGYRRLAMERFFAPGGTDPETDVARVTVAAVGRTTDREGLKDLFDRVSASVRAR